MNNLTFLLLANKSKILLLITSNAVYFIPS